MTPTGVFALALLGALAQAENAWGCRGCVSLDEYSFDKIVTRFKATLVKFDVAYPYGDKHDVFTAFAAEQAANGDLQIAEVGIKEYGEKDNEAFATEQLKVDGTKLPAIKLYMGSRTDSFEFADEITVENLRRFIMQHTNLHLALPGCLEAFDRLASEFMQSDDKNAILQRAEEESGGDFYKTIMRKVISNGEHFVATEMARLARIIKDSKLHPNKKQDLNERLNVLYSFKVGKDEL